MSVLACTVPRICSRLYCTHVYKAKLQDFPSNRWPMGIAIPSSHRPVPVWVSPAPIPTLCYTSDRTWSQVYFSMMERATNSFITNQLCNDPKLTLRIALMNAWSMLLGICARNLPWTR